MAMKHKHTGSRIKESASKLAGEHNMKGKTEQASAALWDKLESATERLEHAVDKAKHAVHDARKGR